jgi:hypothetical protein
MAIEDVVVIAYGMKPVIAPTYRQKLETQKSCDIIHPSS